MYPQTEGLSSSAIAKCVRQLLPHAELLPDPLPEEMRRKMCIRDSSMTVVDTSASSRPALKSSMTSAFSFGLSLPCLNILFHPVDGHKH